MTRGLITSVVTVGTLGLVFAAEATAAPNPGFTVNGTQATGVDPITVQAGQVTFDSTSTPSVPELPIFTTEWDFDGNLQTIEATETTVPHVFPACTGAVNVSLRVTDQDLDPLNTTATLTQPIVVANPTTPPPSAAFDVPSDPLLPGESTTLTAQTSTVAGCTVENQDIQWDFEDNGTIDATGPTATYSSFAPGPHSLRLAVQDSRGLPGGAVRTVVVDAPPVAGFTVSPSSPRVGDEVTLTSFSFDPDGGQPEHLWDLNGDGVYGDEVGPVVNDYRFTDARPYTISLLVRDIHGATATFSTNVNVRPSPMLQPIPNQPSQPNQPSSNNPFSRGNPATTQQPFLRLMSPFPVVRLQGAVVQRGTRIRRLTVRAPKASRVFVYCRGKRCPRKRLSKLANRRTLRFRALERVLPARSLVQVFVRRGDQIGKYTSFLMRRRKVPKRIDGCLLPSSPRAVTCPED